MDVFIIRIPSAGFLCVDFIAVHLPAIPGLREIVYAPAGIRISSHLVNIKSVRSYHFIQP